MKKLFYASLLSTVLITFSFAQDAGPKLETLLGNEFTLSFLPTYVNDKAKGSEGIAINKQTPNFIPSLWDRVKFTLKYDKVLWHTRVVLAAGDKGTGYTLKFDRSYLTYSPIDEIMLEAGMDTSWNLFPGALSMTNDKVILPIVEGGLNGVEAARNIGLWLFYHPTKDITITPYIVAPKTLFGANDATGKFVPTPGVQQLLNTPSIPNAGAGSPPKYGVPLFTMDSTEHYNVNDTRKIPSFGLGLQGYFLDKSIYLAGSYETSFLANHSFFGTANFNKKEDWHSSIFLEGSAILGQYNVARQRSLSLGAGYIGYFGPDNRHEFMVEYIGNFENPNADGRLYKTGHTRARTVAGTFDQELKNTYYDLHSIGLQAKFRVYSGDQLYFLLGVVTTFAGKQLGSINNKANGTMIAPVSVVPQFQIQSVL